MTIVNWVFDAWTKIECGTNLWEKDDHVIGRGQFEESGLFDELGSDPLGLHVATVEENVEAAKKVFKVWYFKTSPVCLR